MTADFLNLEDDLEQIQKAGISHLHMDIMDGNFVPNISYGPKMLEDISKKFDFTIDTHLMVKDPNVLIEDFYKAGSDYIVIHQEVADHLHRQINLIKSLGAKAGVSLNPSTSLDTIRYVLDDLDLILIMSVNPGFGGQSYIPTMTEKIKEAKKMIGNRDIKLQVDGGIKKENIKEVIQAGADMVVVGSAIFDGIDPQARAQEFLELVNEK